jgi:large subunit ribosomal protein L17
MRHGVKNNHLGRKKAHRESLLSTMACQLIEYKRIVTTLAKAKALRVYVEPLLTKSKTDDTNSRRVVFSYLQSKEAIKELFSAVSTKIADRPGGYCRIIKMDRRAGDAADMAMIELVDFNEIYNVKSTVGEEKKKTRRKKSTVKKETSAPEAATEVTEIPALVEAAEETPAVVEETPVVDAVVEAPVVVEEVPVVEAVAEIAAVVEEAPAVVEEAVTTSKADDLKIIEGIGPKIAELFINKGITTFTQLATTSIEDMKAILEEAGGVYVTKDPTTWAAQSQMAADGKMDELKAWQDELNGGKA